MREFLMEVSQVVTKQLRGTFRAKERTLSDSDGRERCLTSRAADGNKLATSVPSRTMGGREMWTSDLS